MLDGHIRLALRVLESANDSRGASIKSRTIRRLLEETDQATPDQLGQRNTFVAGDPLELSQVALLELDLDTSHTESVAPG